MPTPQGDKTVAYNSFAGVDITAVFNDIVIGTLQGISYSITREKAPIYTMGSADPRAFSRGKRGIAGSLIFTMFDSHALTDAMNNSQFARDKEDSGPPQAKGLSQEATLADLQAQTFDFQEEQFTNVADKEWDNPWYADQIPPFDVTLSAANEYGAVSVMRVYGVEILNEGYGVSIDDIVSEQQYTYVCRGIAPWVSKGIVPGKQTKW